jgi:hypothetical protein
MSLIQSFENYQRELAPGLLLRSMTRDEFKVHWTSHYPQVFSERIRVDTQLLMSKAEQLQMEELGSLMGNPLCLRLGVFERGDFIGWHIGDQKSREEFYMRNTGILPAHQGRGVYPMILKAVLELTSELGFQVISSKHNATNNRVIIPKLRAGFIISGLEISDRFGTMVRLEYFNNQWRRELMDLRSGQRDDLSDSMRQFMDAAQTNQSK